MNSDTGDTTSLVPGYPIRTSSDPRSVDNSPRHIAASHVLHRPLMPRHPPCALTHLLHTKNTRQKSNSAFLLDARNHYPTLKHHTPPPSEATNTHNRRAVSKPNSVSGNSFGRRKTPYRHMLVVHPVGPTTDTDPFTAQRSRDGTAFSWCSLERR
jgi:hypothetical protein